MGCYPCGGLKREAHKADKGRAVFRVSGSMAYEWRMLNF